MNKEILERIAPVMNIIKGISWMCFKWLAFTTTLFILPIVVSRIPAFIPEEYKWYVVAVCCGFVFYLLDYGNKYLAKFYHKENILLAKSGKKNTTEGRAWNQMLSLVLIVLIIRLGASFASTWNATPDVAEHITGESKVGGYLEVVKTLSSTSIKTKAEAKEYWTKIAGNESTRKAKAVSAAQAAYNSAYNDGDTWQKIAIDKGELSFLRSSRNKRDKADPKNGKKYSDNDYGDRVSRALYNLKIAGNAEADLTIKAKNQLDKLNSGNTKNKEISKIVALASQEASRYDQKLERRSNYLYIADLIAAVLGLLLVRIETLSEVANKDYSIVKSPLTSVRTWWKNYEYRNPLSVVPDNERARPVKSPKKDRNGSGHNGYKKEKETLFP